MVVLVCGGRDFKDRALLYSVLSGLHAPPAPIVVAFPGGAGTSDMVRRAREAGVEVREVKGG